MTTADLRPDEAQVLAALLALEVLDTAPEVEFDALARAAALACGMPIAMVSLVDADRQWFKANVGLPGVVETPRDVAFCAHAVLGNGILEVPDATRDPRFAENPLVTGAPAIRFYAGVPVRVQGGLAVGTLCVIDREPRELDTTQRQILECLAVAAGRALESRRAGIALERVTFENDERMRRLYERTPAMLHAVDGEGRIVMVSNRWLERLGYAREQVLGRFSSDFLTLHPDDVAPRDALPPRPETGGCDAVELQMVAQDGEVVDVLLSAFVERDPQGMTIRSLAVMADVTLQRRAENADRDARQELMRQSVTLQSVTEAIPDMVTVVTMDGTYRFANGAFQAWCGRRVDQILGRKTHEVLGEAEFQRRAPWVEQAMAGKRVEFDLDYPSRDGVNYLGISYIPLRLESGEADGFVVVSHDITQQKREERRLFSLSHRDPLTGLLNRAGLDYVLEHQAHAGTSESIALLYIDLDRFKPVNDSYGHTAGDQILKAFANRLLQLVRPTDAVARRGGDEFVIALMGTSSQAVAQSVAEKVLAAASAPFKVGQSRILVGASIGIATDCTGDNDWQALINRADANLLEAKGAGRGRHSAGPAPQDGLNNPRSGAG